MSTGWTIGGLDLRKVGYNIETTDGWDSFPEVRSSRSEHGFRHGERRGNRIFYKSRDLSFTMALLGIANSGDPAGLSREEYFQLHLDAIFRALHTFSGEVLVSRTVGATTRTGIVRVDDAIPVTQRSQGSRALVLRTTLINPFWLGAAFDVNPLTSGDFNNLGSAPINDMTLIFTGAGSVTNSDDVVTAASSATVNLREDTVTNGGVPVNGVVTVTSPWVLQLEPGLNTLAVTGTVRLQGNYSYF